MADNKDDSPKKSKPPKKYELRHFEFIAHLYEESLNPSEENSTLSEITETAGYSPKSNGQSTNVIGNWAATLDINESDLIKIVTKRRREWKQKGKQLGAAIKQFLRAIDEIKNPSISLEGIISVMSRTGWFGKILRDEEWSIKGTQIHCAKQGGIFTHEVLDLLKTEKITFGIVVLPPEKSKTLWDDFSEVIWSPGTGEVEGSYFS